MKKIVRPMLTVGLSLILALLSAALTYSTQPAQQGKLSAAGLFLQPTATPQPGGISEIGSTDGIVILGGIIVMIVIIPILLRRKHWMQST